MPDPELKQLIKQLMLAELTCTKISLRPQLIQKLQSQGYLDSELKLTPKARSRLKLGLVGGVFDLIHPGHLFFLEQAKRRCDILIAVVARDSMVVHKPKPKLPEDFRLKLVSALKPVDLAVLGSTQDMFEPVAKFNPDLIILGPDQHFSEEWIRDQLKLRKLSAQVIRIRSREKHPLAKTSQVIRRITESAQT